MGGSGARTTALDVLRRPTTVELMLLTTVVLWALHLTVTRYVLTHRFEPLAYSTLRYGAAALIFIGLTILLERTLRLGRRNARLALGASALLFVNQVSFVYALDRTTASTVGLILGATSIFAALIGLALGLERLGSRFWLATLVSFAGVALVATGAGGELSGDLLGNLLAVVTAASWAGQRIGPSRATLAANLQPFVAAVFAVVLLFESMTGVQVAGGCLIALGIALARARRRLVAPGAE